MENWFFAGIVWVCAAGFFAIAAWSYFRKTPMHFWSGSTVSPEEISDTKRYNRANGHMWTVFASVMAILGVVGVFSPEVAGILLAVLCVGGIPVLVVIYNRIYKRYSANKKEPLL